MSDASRNPQHEVDLIDIVHGLSQRIKIPWLLRHHSHRTVLAIFSLLSGGLSIALLAMLSLVTRSPFIFPSLGPTAFLIFSAPLAPSASPRNTLMGHSVAIGAAVISIQITGLSLNDAAITQEMGWARVIAAALSLGITAGLMVLLATPHPPAGATTLIVSLGLLTYPWQLAVLLGGVVLLLLEALVINRLAGIPYPLWFSPASAGISPIERSIQRLTLESSPAPPSSTKPTILPVNDHSIGAYPMSLSTMTARVEHLTVSAYTIPTDAPEADGTFAWDATTLVLVEAASGNTHGIGYTYADSATARFIHEHLLDIAQGSDAMNVASTWAAMVRAIRNFGRPGVASMAIAAVDAALWDLKARLLDLPLVSLLGATRADAPIYGSGGFTTYSIERLQQQLQAWVAQGIPRVKMKIGTHPEADLGRVQAAREAIGDATPLFVDANGAYSRKQALAQVEAFARFGVTWFEEPVSSDDLAGLRLIRDRAPAGTQIAAGEYGYDLDYFRRMLDAGAVDVLQADATRCAGITGFLRAATLAEAHHLPLSAHCAPSLHVHPACAIANLFPIEYFHDHVRIEQMLFDGVLTPKDGVLQPDLSRPGMGITFKHADARRYVVS